MGHVASRSWLVRRVGISQSRRQTSTFGSAGTCQQVEDNRQMAQHVDSLIYRARRSNSNPPRCVVDGAGLWAVNGIVRHG